MTKSMIAIIHFKNDITPDNNEHKKYIAQKFMDQKIGDNNPVTVEVVGNMTDEISRLIEQTVWK